MKSTTKNKKSGLASKLLVAVAAGTLALMAPAVMAQQHGGGGKGGGGGHDGGSGTSHTSGDDGHSSHDSGGGGKGRKKGGQEAGRGKGSGGSSLRDVFREMEDEAAAEKGKKGPPQGKGPSAEKSKGSDQAKKGKKPDAADAEEEESDRPAWAGPNPTEPKPGSRSTEPGIKKGDIYGDLFVVVRNEDGTPKLDDSGKLQVYYVVKNEDGEITGTDCCIPYVDGELDASYTPVEVELGRLSVGRSPDRVLAAQLMDVISSIEQATEIDTDAAGRIVLTIDGEEKTIDSPLANLALYKALMTDGIISYTEKVDGEDVVVPVDLSAIGIDTNPVLTSSELLAAASFFAAASDKVIPVTIDAVVYMNSILGISDASYSALTSYSRETEYNIVDDPTTPDVNEAADAPVVLQPKTVDGTTVWVATAINPYETIFSSTAASELLTVKDDNTALSFAEAFTVAADDARQVIDFLHTYSVPDTN